MADAPPQPALHPTDRLIGTAPAVASLRARSATSPASTPWAAVTFLPCCYGARPAPARAWWRASSTTVHRGPRVRSSR